MRNAWVEVLCQVDKAHKRRNLQCAVNSLGTVSHLDLCL